MRAAAAAALASAALLGLAAAPAPAAQLTRIAVFSETVQALEAPGRQSRGLVFAVQKTGEVMVVRRGRPLARPFLDIGDRVLAPQVTEQGLLSVAFHPRYARNGRLYAMFTERNGDNAVFEFRRSRASAARAVPSSGRRIITFPHPDDDPNHNGGTLAFGPDGRLYISTGDGGTSPLAAQDPASLLGKILRIEPLAPEDGDGARRQKGRRYAIPRGNPFAGRVPGRGEVYSLGLRNPWRFSFDRATGALVIGDVGFEAREEIDYRDRGTARGANFGWPRFEGNLLLSPGVAAPGAIPPVHEYANGTQGVQSDCAVTGGYVIRDPRLASLAGRYLYADYCTGVLRTLVAFQGGSLGDAPLAGVPPVIGLSSFGEGRGGVVYVVSLDGSVYRLDP
jgi:glucose/arabinose dehydrogenase